MLECHMEVLVQYEVAQLLAVEWLNERLAILLVTTISRGCWYGLRDLRLAHANHTAEQCILWVPHTVNVRGLYTLVERHLLECHSASPVVFDIILT